MPRRSTLPASEADIEAALRDVLRMGGFYPVKTDAAQISRGGRPGTLPRGFPDGVHLYRIPGSLLCLAALVELKTQSGKLRASQVECHAELRDVYGLHPHVLRDPREAVALIQEAQRLSKLMKESCQER